MEKDKTEYLGGEKPLLGEDESKEAILAKIRLLKDEE